MRKLILLIFLYVVAIEAYPQWTRLCNDASLSVTAFDSTVISGVYFGPYNLAVSYDQGNSWTGNNLLQSDGVDYLCADDSMIYACTPNGIYRTQKDTLNWSSYNEGLPTGQINKIILKDSILLATSNSSVFQRIVGDTTWTTLCEISPVATINDFDYDGNTLVLAGNDGIAESNDMGLSWNQWPTGYIFQFDAVKVKGDTIIAGSAAGIFRKLISMNNISKVSNGLEELWSPYEDDFYGIFEQFYLIGDHIFVCGMTGVYKLSDNTWEWQITGLGSQTYALASNAEMLYAAGGSNGIWGRPLNQLILSTNAVPVVKSPINIYPNPANTIITIATQTTPRKNTSLTVINLQGQQLIKIHLTETNTMLDVQAFPPGVYFAKITDGTTVKTVKFLKR